MAVIPGSIKGVTLVHSSVGTSLNGAENTYLVTADFPAYVAAADTASLPAVGAAIASRTRSGKTVTLRGGLRCGPGVSNAGADVYMGAATVSSDDLTFSLTAVNGSSEVSDFTTAVGVQALVLVTES